VGTEVGWIGACLRCKIRDNGKKWGGEIGVFTS